MTDEPESSGTNDYDASDRRPIAQRETGWARAINRVLVRSPLTPNQISVVGMLFGIATGVIAAMIDGTGAVDRWLWIAVAVLVPLRLGCNMFDGMVAMARGTASPVGELYNEAPDRIADAAVLIGIGHAAGGDVTAGYAAAVAAVFVAYVRAMAKSAGAPNDFCGPMAKPHRMFLIAALAIYMGVTPIAWRWEFGEARCVLWLILAGCVVTAIRRLVRAARHLRGARP